MDVLKNPHDLRTCVRIITVQISTHKIETRGLGKGNLYVVEVLFPDGTWARVGHSRKLVLAQAKAVSVAKKRNAILLSTPQSTLLYTAPGNVRTPTGA